MSEVSRRIVFPENHILPTLFGIRGANLKHLGQSFNVKLTQRGNVVTIYGEDQNCTHVAATLQYLYDKTLQGKEITLNITQQAIHETRNVASQTSKKRQRLKVGDALLTPRNDVQASYLEALQQDTLIIAQGEAGTGKTFLAVVCAMQALLSHQVSRIILTRPVVDAGEKIGYLPGDVREKIDPYLRPIFDSLYACASARAIENLITNKKIEIAPLAYMRGRTLDNAFILLDEAQNATDRQMCMFLTRLGENSRMVITGDSRQSDLPPHQLSGLREASNIVSDLPGVSIFSFKRHHIVRHPLIEQIITRYSERDRRIRQKQELYEGNQTSS